MMNFDRLCRPAQRLSFRHVPAVPRPPPSAPPPRPRPGGRTGYSAWRPAIADVGPTRPARLLAVHRPPAFLDPPGRGPRSRRLPDSARLASRRCPMPGGTNSIYRHNWRRTTTSISASPGRRQQERADFALHGAARAWGQQTGLPRPVCCPQAVIGARLRLLLRGSRRKIPDCLRLPGPEILRRCR
jgi:hypothetical protein